ncbi:hypothetical protein Rhe02_54070 [Rhizocola hellebori]|uniref:Uncharacterized protein n=1 Tax=Rhizocola hellebori TaxID=1392758 RepID=A0A8J3QCW2_9ACTN|nr:hypothetical protein [Rhizocola hellebori]GIH07340.1 hypothetical protein Rhe02_54070 [Rhizocola hellebori]
MDMNAGGILADRKIRRRRRILTAATAAAIAALIGGYQFLPAAPVPPAESASPSPSPSAAAEIGHGLRLMAHDVVPLSAKSLSLVWTPTSAKGTHISSICRDVESVEVQVEVLVNGKLIYTGSCASSTFTTFEDVPGMRLGTPATVIIKATGAVRYDPVTNASISVPVPAIGALEVDVYQRLSFEEAVLPTRPANLKPLQDTNQCLGVRSNPGDPLQPATVSLIWDDTIFYLAESQTPGELELAVNGHSLMTLGFWDYDLTPYIGSWDTTQPGPGRDGLTPPQRGQTVTLSVTPRHVTGAWQVKFDWIPSGPTQFAIPRRCGGDR